MSAFGDTLKATRERRRGLSQSRLARRVGCEHSYVSRLESGQRDPSRDMATRLADALGATPAERAELMHAAGFATVELTPEVERFAAMPVEWQRRALAFVELAREGRAA